MEGQLLLIYLVDGRWRDGRDRGRVQFMSEHDGSEKSYPLFRGEVGAHVLYLF